VKRYDGGVTSIASGSTAGNGTRELPPSTLKRVAFAVMFAVIATGMTFYVISFGAMYASLGSGKLNPPVSPGVTWSLREIGVPVSLAVGIIVFGVTLWRSRKTNR